MVNSKKNVDMGLRQRALFDAARKRMISRGQRGLSNANAASAEASAFVVPAFLRRDSGAVYSDAERRDAIRHVLDNRANPRRCLCVPPPAPSVVPPALPARSPDPGSDDPEARARARAALGKNYRLFALLVHPV
jgi:hypothetical protein